MRIQVKVKAGARENCVSFDEEKNLYIISTKVPPIEGRANEAVIKLIAKYFKVTKSQVSFKIGQKSKTKVFKIDH